MTTNTCLHCGDSLGLRRFAGAQYCSEAHAQTNAGLIPALMLKRLRDSAMRYRQALDASKPMRKAS